MKENKRGGNRTKLLTPQVLSLIEFYIESQPGITLKAIKTKLLRENEINISTSCIEYGLRKLKITFKMASIEIERKNDSRTLGLRQKYAQDFTKWIPQQGEKLIFIDECGFNLHIRRTQARSRQGTRAHIVLPTVRGRNVTIIAAINNAGVVHHTIVSNSSVNADRFKLFIEIFFLRKSIQSWKITLKYTSDMT